MESAAKRTHSEQYSHGDAPSPFLPVRWLCLVLPAIVVGSILRLYDLPDQVLLDDEWHSLNYVIGKPFFSLFVTQGMGANCIPQNIYNHVLLHTLGWSEMLLRLPSILAGILSLIVFPWVVLRIYGRFTSVVFAYLLALSPCVIFYSRICRPYSMVMFFGFLSLLSMMQWMKIRKAAPMVLYALSGFVAIYYHLYAAIPVLTPLLCILTFHACRKTGFCRFDGYQFPTVTAVFVAGGIVLGLSLVLIAPASLANPWWNKVQGVDRVTLGTFIEYSSLLSGTHTPLLRTLFVSLVVMGLVFLVGRNRPVGIIVAAVIGLFFGQIVLSTQDAIHAAIMVARYGIVLFPLAFLLASLALQSVFSGTVGGPRAGYWRIVAPAVFIGGLLISSPLWAIYCQPNNFMNQSAFQHTYMPTDWSTSRVRDLTPFAPMRKADIPRLYFDTCGLAGTEGLIEYPMLIGDHFNPYYYYQVFHRKDVRVGYVPELDFAQLPSSDEWVYGNTPIDYVLVRAQDSRRQATRFRNMLPITNVGLLKERFGGWLLVVHKNPMGEIFPRSRTENGRATQPSRMLVDSLSRALGSPSIDDRNLVVWRIGSSR